MDDRERQACGAKVWAALSLVETVSKRPSNNPGFLLAMAIMDLRQALRYLGDRLPSQTDLSVSGDTSGDGTISGAIHGRQ